MAETTYTRARRASLGGLIVQILAFGIVLALGRMTHSLGTYHLAWYLLGGVPIWFVALLVFRQRELSALEALDLEELRREKEATGGGEALFDAEGGGFRVAEARLRWMQRWLVPGFGLATAVYLCLIGILRWRRLRVSDLDEGGEILRLAIGGAGWPALQNVPVAMVILAIVMLGIFLLSRYTSGMGRVRDWQLLRGCGAYMLGNAIVIMVLLVLLGVQQYAGIASWEQTLAYGIPLLMIVLGLEILINFVLDIYRPRSPAVEPRACFDSRLLGLFAEPGGIAHSIAEAVNYQFGFQVSQTWFYQLLQRAFVGLVATGALALLLLTCIVVVQPYEHVIIERWGRQLNAADPLGPGIHFKLPWPWEMARAYNTGQLHQLSVGFRDFDATPEFHADGDDPTQRVLLWTDDRHYGLEHFDFLISPNPRQSTEAAAEPADREAGLDEDGRFEAFPVYLLRTEIVVQYRIRVDRLGRYAQQMVDPHRTLQALAWEEVGRFFASSTADYLMGKERALIGDRLRAAITERVEELQLGLEVVYVGVANVHPERTVAEAYRDVIRAEQQKIGDIREAMVAENQRLSKVAGDTARARALVRAIDQSREAAARQNDALRALRELEQAVIGAAAARLADLEPLLKVQVQAADRRDRARARRAQLQQDFELGLGKTLQEQERAAAVVRDAEAAERAAADAVEQELAPLRRDLAAQLNATRADALVALVQAGVAGAYWQEQLARDFTQTQLEGEAAARLAEALAERWTIETEEAARSARARYERDAYRAAPEVYKVRRLTEALVEGIKDARKFFLAFDPGDRLVRVRIVAEDEAQTELINIRPPDMSME